MTHHDLIDTAQQLPAAWRSTVLARAAGAQIKVLRMDGQAYPDETHDFDEALIVLEGVMHLTVAGHTQAVTGGQMVVVPAGLPHAVAPGSEGTLLIVDR